MAEENVLGTYSPEEVTLVISVAGKAHVVTGFADGTFINVTRMTPASELYVGADLTAGRTKRRNKAANITVSLAQYSASNDVFQAIQTADEEDPTDAYVFSMTLKDNSGRTLFSSSQAFIATQADVTLSTTMETRDWAIAAVSLNSFIGGNARLSDPVVDTLAALDVDVDPRWRLNP